MKYEDALFFQALRQVADDSVVTHQQIEECFWKAAPQIFEQRPNLTQESLHDYFVEQLLPGLIENIEHNTRDLLVKGMEEL